MGNRATFTRADPNSIDALKPGQWSTVFYDREGVRRKSAVLMCPVCKTWGSLRTSDGQGHEILSDGTVNPSVVCAQPGCTFHEYIKLEGWEA